MLLWQIDTTINPLIIVIATRKFFFSQISTSW